jgi:hypothetical protein
LSLEEAHFVSGREIFPPPGFNGHIREDLEESRLPFKVDLVDLNEMADAYRVAQLQTHQKLKTCFSLLTKFRIFSN